MDWLRKVNLVRDRLGLTNRIFQKAETIFQNKDVEETVAQIRKEYRATQTAEYDLKNRMAEQRAKEQESHEIFTVAWTANKNAYEAKELSPLFLEETKLSNDIAVAQARLDGVTDPIQRLPLVVAHEDAKLELAKFRVRLAEKKYLVSSNIVANLASFNDPILLAKSKAEYAKIGELEHAWEENQAKLQEVRSKIWKLSDDIRTQQLERLGFEDFLYFSLGVSTTTTFGDITPNTRGARRLVIVQLVICTLLVGLFVTHLGNRVLP